MIATPIEAEGLVETIASVTGAMTDLDTRRAVNRELRQAGRRGALELGADLRAAAAGGPPVAARVARSIRAKNDRIPAVSIGGNRKVGARGARAAALVWGSEHGPAGPVNHFGVAANPGGYWIAPTVKRFGASRALALYKQAIVDIFRAHKLL